MCEFSELICLFHDNDDGQQQQWQPQQQQQQQDSEKYDSLNRRIWSIRLFVSRAIISYSSSLVVGHRISILFSNERESLYNDGRALGYYGPSKLSERH